MKDNQAKYPQLRFKGFTDPWEQRKLGELNDVRDGTHDSPKYVVNGHPFVTSKNLSDQGLDLSDVSYISDEDFAAFNKRSKVDVGDILFGMIGTIGHPVLVESDSFAIKNVALIKGGGKISNCYLLQLLKSPVFDRYVKLENAGGTQKFLGLNLVRDFVLRVPNDDEQRKIGTFFAYLDNLIAVNQRKLAKLKELKQGYLQKLFPKNGSKFPQLRFAGFADAWEQRKLGELGKIYTGNTPKTSDLDNWTDNKEGHIWITPTDIDKLIMSDSDRHLSEQGWSKARKIPENSVLITSIASIGKNTINAVPVAFNQQINAIVPEKNDSYFILSAMIKDTARFASVAGQTATAIINKTTFEKFQIATPSYEEQQKIGSFFKQLDNTITLHQRKLEKLQELKKGYLKKMFC
ncbi:restriction endonuclease subunit S [Lactiplantibacillus plantarum]|nr:restriction endonuclease subunit S [Lactiplantibacillus plantarum]